VHVCNSLTDVYFALLEGFPFKVWPIMLPMHPFSNPVLEFCFKLDTNQASSLTYHTVYLMIRSKASNLTGTIFELQGSEINFLHFLFCEADVHV
jgi:hypothetical protein